MKPWKFVENHGSGEIDGLYCTGALCTIQSLKYSARHRAYLLVSLRKSRLPWSIFWRRRAFQKKLVTCLVFFLMVSRYGRPWRAIFSETFQIVLKFTDFCRTTSNQSFWIPNLHRKFRRCPKCEFCKFLGFQNLLKNANKFWSSLLSNREFEKRGPPGAENLIFTNLKNSNFLSQLCFHRSYLVGNLKSIFPNGIGPVGSLWRRFLYGNSRS